MTEHLFFEEMDMLLDGIINAPSRIVNCLLTNKYTTTKQLEKLFDENDQKFIDGWVRRMIDHLVVERFYWPSRDENTYELTLFAQDMIEHINNFRVVTKGGKLGR